MVPVLNTRAERKRPIATPNAVILTSGLVDSSLALVKIAVGVFTGYLPLMASGFHSLSDLILDVSAWVTMHMSRRGADERFHYGHRRAGTVVALLAAVFLVFVGLQLVVEVFTHNYGNAPVQGLVVPLLIGVVATMSMPVKEFLFRTVRRSGAGLNSPFLINNAWHHRVDMFSSLIVLVSLVFVYIRPETPYIEQVATMLIVGLILHTSWEVGSSAIKELIDFRPSLEIQRMIDALIEDFEEITFIQSTRIRTMGGALYVELIVETEPALTVDDLYDVIQQVRERIMGNVPNVIDIIIMTMPKGEYAERMTSAD